MRHTVNIYGDELEQYMGAVRMAANDAGDMERVYYQGAYNCLAIFADLCSPGNHQAFVARLKMHFEEEPNER